MYLPKHFAEPRNEVMHALMRAHPLATLITLGAQGLDANHIPLLLDEKNGTLRGHLARTNPLWREADGLDVLAIFQGPECYITPNWYPAKQETGKVVPTWNYAVVHVHGRLRVIDDAGWLRAQIDALTRQEEATRPLPWQVADAPADYIEKMLGAIVGIEIGISRLTGKWKTSQNQTADNRAGVAAGLRVRATQDDLQMAELVSRQVTC